MTWVKQAFGSSVGLKYIMAITGLALLGFVIMHMLGNLLVFLGPDALNAYAAKLHSMGALLWVARIILLTLFLLHVGTAARLSMENREARPQRYIFNGTVKASLPSRTMLVSGLLVFLFVLYHLAHFTLRWVHTEAPGLDAQERIDVYGMVVTSFGNPLVAGIYIAAQLLLFFHLWHGGTSLFQSLGINHERYNKVLSAVGPTVAVILLIGNLSMPIAALTGILKISN